jgi:hypothetical protein
VALEPDTNQYNVCHVTVDHPLMSRSELYDAFRAAWRQYYSTSHVKTIFMRALAAGSHLSIFTTALYAGSMDIEGEHPLEIGLLRRKIRLQRRPGLPIEPRSLFYPRRLLEILVANSRWGWLFSRYWAIKLMARWAVSRQRYGEWRANNETVPLGTGLMDTYFGAIPESQRRTVAVLKKLQIRIGNKASSADLEVIASPPSRSPR